jgi:hypothetical protein
VFLFRARAEEGRSSVRIASLLHFFDPTYFGGNEPIFDQEDWAGWTKDWRSRVGANQYTAVLFVLACVAVAVIWLT